MTATYKIKIAASAQQENCVISHFNQGPMQPRLTKE